MENLNNQTSVRPSSSLVSAIAALILYWPMGIPAVIYAVRVDPLWKNGLHTEARVASATAAKLGLIGVIIGACNIALAFVAGLLYFFVVMGAILSEL